MVQVIKRDNGKNTWRPASIHGFVSRLREMPRPMPATHQLQQPENSLDGRRDGQCHVWSSGQAGSLCVYHVYQFPCWFTQSLPNDRSSVRSSCNVLLGDLGYNDSGILVSNKIRKNDDFTIICQETCVCSVSVLPLTFTNHVLAIPRIFGLQTLFHSYCWWFVRNPANLTSWGTGSWTPII